MYYVIHSSEIHQELIVRPFVNSDKVKEYIDHIDEKEIPYVIIEGKWIVSINQLK